MLQVGPRCAPSRSRVVSRSRAHALPAFILLAVLVISGCAREPEEVREVRLAANRYVSALAGKDLAEIRNRATCVVAVQSVQGGNVLRIGPGRRLSVAALDSLASAASVAHEKAESVWVHAGSADREARFQEVRRTGRLEVTYRNAARAVALSSSNSLLTSAAQLETRMLRVRIRYAGSVIGPKPVDKEMVLRLLKAPSGKWIAFSLYTAEDDPRPDGV